MVPAVIDPAGNPQRGYLSFNVTFESSRATAVQESLSGRPGETTAIIGELAEQATLLTMRFYDVIVAHSLVGYVRR